MNRNDELPDNLARALQALDGEASRAAARLDASQVAQGVLQRLRAEPLVAATPARRRHARALRIAAAAIVLVIGGVLAQRLALSPTEGAVVSAGGLPVSVPADSMDAGQATELLAAVEQVRTLSSGVTDSAATTSRTVSVDDLSETELRTLLRFMESSEDTK